VGDLAWQNTQQSAIYKFSYKLTKRCKREGEELCASKRGRRPTFLKGGKRRERLVVGGGEENVCYGGRGNDG